MSSSVAITEKKISFATSSALNTHTVSNLPRSPMPKSISLSELDSGAGCESSPSLGPATATAVYQESTIAQSPIGCTQFVAFTDPIPAATPTSHSPNLNISTRAPVGLGLGDVGGSFGTITIMTRQNSPVPPSPRHQFPVGLGIRFGSPVLSPMRVFQSRATVSSPIGLGFGNITGFDGATTPLSPTSSTISLPNPFSPSPGAPDITFADGSTRKKALVGLGFGFIDTANGTIITSSPALPTVPRMDRSLSEPHHRNLVPGPFLVPLGSSPILPYVARSQSVTVGGSAKSPMPSEHVRSPGYSAFALDLAPNFTPLIPLLTPSPFIYVTYGTFEDL